MEMFFNSKFSQKIVTFCLENDHCAPLSRLRNNGNNVLVKLYTQKPDLMTAALLALSLGIMTINPICWYILHPQGTKLSKGH